jgi:hypothetical protein
MEDEMSSYRESIIPFGEWRIMLLVELIAVRLAVVEKEQMWKKREMKATRELWLTEV